MQYYSDREYGERPQNQTVFTLTAWEGIEGKINSLINDGSLGWKFPENCPDGQVPCGCDLQLFSRILSVEIPGLTWPLLQPTTQDDFFSPREQPFLPETSAILDLIEFIYKYVSKPNIIGHHQYYKHDHFMYDKCSEKDGKEEFRDWINSIFKRNGLAYSLNLHGHIEKILPCVFNKLIDQRIYSSGDCELDALLSDAINIFMSPKKESRHDALAKLWDSWERLKALFAENKRQKSKSTEKVIKIVASGSSIFEELLNTEASEITKIGNTCSIRHTEGYQQKITDGDHIDYLFYRLWSLIHLSLQKISKVESKDDAVETVFS